MSMNKIAWVLLIIGGLNWGLKVFGADIATWGLPDGLMTVVYALVGLSAVFMLFNHKSSGSQM